VLLRSWSNTLISVRQATRRNAGRKTAGIDGQVALTGPSWTLDLDLIMLSATDAVVVDALITAE
jgi:hypothetical protein